MFNNSWAVKSKRKWKCCGFLSNSNWLFILSEPFTTYCLYFLLLLN